MSFKKTGFLILAITIIFISASCAQEPSSLFEKSPQWTCKITAQSYCTGTAGTCVASKPVSWIKLKLMPDKSIAYNRCDAKGCSPNPGTYTTVKAFTIINLPRAGALLKISNTDSSFIDFATKEGNGLVGFGKCVPET